MSKFKFDADNGFKVEVKVNDKTTTYDVQYLKTKKQVEIAKKMKELKDDHVGQFEYSLDLLEALGLPKEASEELTASQLDEVINHATGIDKKKLQK